MPPVPPPAKCRQCGCTDEFACAVKVDGKPRGCRWVEPEPDDGPLCSACSGDEVLIHRGPVSVRTL